MSKIKNESRSRRRIALVLLCWSWPLLAETGKPTDYPENFTPREHAWSIGTSVRQLKVNAAYDYKLNALAPYLDIGRGWVHPAWWSLIELNLILGPNGKRLPDSPPLDFTGTGVRMRAGRVLPGQLMRHSSGDWGAELGLEYNEWIARSYQDEKLSDGTTSTSWVVRSRWIFVQPALFYSLWQPARPRGHKPEWITTRIEGVVFSLGMSIPIQSQMQASYTKGTERHDVTDHWHGTLAFFSLTSWLGI